MLMRSAWTVMLLGLFASAHALSATETPAAAAPAKPLKKPPAKAIANPASKQVEKPVAKRPNKPAPDPKTLPADAAASLTEEQLALVPRVTTGVLPCEMAHTVSVQAHPHHPGHFVLQSGKQRFAMVPVATSTGAIRLEDAERGAVWLQLANKSMLMDHKRGRRLADACMSAEQKAVAAAMEKDPASHLLAPAAAGAPNGEFATK